MWRRRGASVGSRGSCPGSRVTALGNCRERANVEASGRKRECMFPSSKRMTRQIDRRATHPISTQVCTPLATPPIGHSPHLEQVVRLVKHYVLHCAKTEVGHLSPSPRGYSPHQCISVHACARTQHCEAAITSWSRCTKRPGVVIRMSGLFASAVN